MSDQFRVELDQFRSLIPRFAELQADTTTAGSRLVQGLESEGECWGADEVGTTFAAKYVTASQDTIEAITDLAALFGVIGEKVGHTADSFEQTDTGTGGVLGSIEPGGEG
jgi:uncharacterized protein YukE